MNCGDKKACAKDRTEVTIALVVYALLNPRFFFVQLHERQGCVSSKQPRSGIGKDVIDMRWKLDGPERYKDATHSLLHLPTEGFCGAFPWIQFVQKLTSGHCVYSWDSVPVRMLRDLIMRYNMENGGGRVEQVERDLEDSGDWLDHIGFIECRVKQNHSVLVNSCKLTIHKM